MLVKYNKIFDKNVTEIFVGEYYVTNKSEIISTLLGSCISICMIDTQNNVYGMNHFLLPSNDNKFDINSSSKFGDNSIRLLINRMIKKGAKKEQLKAKVFGGGKVLKSAAGVITVNMDNIQFVHKYLEQNNIEIIAKDVDGDYGRKIYFNTSDGSVYVRKIMLGENEEVIE